MFTHTRRFTHFCVYIAVLVVLVLAPAQAKAAKLIVIIAADNANRQGGESFLMDYYHISGLAKDISDYTGLELVLKKILGQRLTRFNVFHTINSLSVGSDDVLLFFFAGHGRNSGGVWPEMIFTRGEHRRSQWDYVGFSEIIDSLKSQGARLLIALADCCNSYIEEDKVQERRIQAAVPGRTPEGYKKLFWYHRGYYLACGSVPGKEAFSTKDDGGVFTGGFLKMLEEEVYSPDPSWYNLEEPVLYYLTSHPDQEHHPYATIDYEQYPYYEIDVTFVDRETSSSPAPSMYPVIELDGVLTK